MTDEDYVDVSFEHATVQMLEEILKSLDNYSAETIDYMLAWAEGKNDVTLSFRRGIFF